MITVRMMWRIDYLHAEGIAELVQRIDSVDGRSFIPKASASIGPAI